MMKSRLLVPGILSAFCVVAMGMFGSCKSKEAKMDEEILELGLEPMPALEHPSDNPTSDAKVALGRALFWDPIVGGEKDMACATCHHPDFGYSDGLDLPIGVRGSGLGPARTEGSGIDRVPRNSPSVLNLSLIHI